MEYPKCKCGKTPATDINDFNTVVSEFGMFGKIAVTDILATCKTCKEEFKFHEDKTSNQNLQ